MREFTEAERRELLQAQANLLKNRELSRQQNLKQNCEQVDNLKKSRTLAPSEPESIASLAGLVMSNDPKAAEYDPPAPLPCEYCGALRHTKGIFLGNRIMWLPSGPEPCTCEQAQAELQAQEQAKQEAEAKRLAAEAAAKQKARIAEIIGASGMGERFKRRTFAAFEQKPENVTAYRTAAGYAENFARLATCEKNGLFIIGPKGTGKTHLAAAVANKLMADGKPVLFATMIALLGKIKETFNRENTKMTEAELMRLYKQVDLLIIDDMGKEPPTAWALAKMYEIINDRYEDYKPIIVTSNYTADELVKRLTPIDGDNTTADATVDRILEMTYTVALAGESWRTK